MKYIVAIFAFWMLVISCSKDKSYDPINTTDTSGLASFEVKNTDSTIYATQYGTFVQGVTYDSANSYFILPITVDKGGTFSINAYAIFNADTLFLSNSDTLTIYDTQIKLYPSNISQFGSGTYTSADSTLNKIVVNDSTLTHPFVANLTVN
ncbi:hypothetical protein [Rhizosphaericola mali]|uniref:Uncharacterized protein n=1 Tax=Rhizosphaericola mali TaxID=2545455 RepID=A0A5P2G2D1_9BACT|nr:hypothetical protein [Rhizosphaericola mali]QES89964.1 hypothetical protein E0W69_015285 [Rhizosphaericola mali]